MALADILQRIGEDAIVEAQEIVKEAEAAAEAVRSEALERARARTHEVVERATAEAQAAARTRLATARLAARDNALTAKRHLVERVLARVVSHLESLPAEEYTAFIVRGVKRIARSGESVSIGHGDHGRLALSLAQALAGAGVDVSVRGTTGAIERGVLIEGDRVKVEVSARSLAASNRERLVEIISTSLFGDGEAVDGSTAPAAHDDKAGETT